MLLDVQVASAYETLNDPNRRQIYEMVRRGGAARDGDNCCRNEGGGISGRRGARVARFVTFVQTPSTVQVRFPARNERASQSSNASSPSSDSSEVRFLQASRFGSRRFQRSQSGANKTNGGRIGGFSVGGVLKEGGVSLDAPPSHRIRGSRRCVRRGWRSRGGSQLGLLQSLPCLACSEGVEITRGRRTTRKQLVWLEQ